MVVFILLSTVLAGCSDDSGKQTLYVYNVGTYIDKSVNEMFEEEFNCKVVYETYDSNESMYYKVVNATSNYDVIFPSDYMLEKMINEDLVLPLDFGNIPNFANIRDELKGGSFDENNTYGVPYFYGTVGILYNKEMVTEPVDSWGILWDEKYADNILMYDSQRDSLGIALKYLGYSMNTRSEEEVLQAEKALIQQKPLIVGYFTDRIMDMMIGEEGALAVVYSGDAVYCMSENENLAYAVPEEGSNVWIDCMAIPKTSKNKELAEAYINFMCRDDISMLNTQEVMYSSANKNLESDLRKEEWANNDTYFVPQDVMDRCEFFNDLGDFLPTFAQSWENVKSAQ